MKKDIKVENVLMAVSIFFEVFIFLDLIFLVSQDIGIRTKLIVTLIVGFVLGVNAIITRRSIFPGFCEKNRDTWCCNNHLTIQEKTIVDDARSLLKKVCHDGELVNVKIYSIRIAVHSWMRYDEENDEISIYVPFKKFMKYGKDFCFYSVLFNIILAQHFQKNKYTFSNFQYVFDLNNLLTVWLVKNYSEKYKEPDQICIVDFWIGAYNVKYNLKYNIVNYQSTAIAEMCVKRHKKLEEVFQNYVDFQPQYFFDLIPERYR